MKKKKVSTKSQIVCEFNFYNSAKRLRRLNIYEKSRNLCTLFQRYSNRTVHRRTASRLLELCKKQ